MKISVIMLTYNHGKYIEKAVQSVCAQQGDFQLEIIIGDDCSTDNTAEVIDELAAKHKEIKIFRPEKNIGMHANLKKCLSLAEGDYISMCEGDDWYISPYKLQMQMEFLEKNKDCVMCSHSYIEYNQKEDKYSTINYQQDYNGGGIYCFEQLVTEYKWTNFTTYMYRKEVINKLPEFIWELNGADYSFNMHCAVYGNLGIIKEPLSVYRAGIGQWSSFSLIKQQQDTLDFAYISKEHFHKYYNGKYDDIFDKRIEKSIKNLKRVKAKAFKNKIRRFFKIKEK